MHKKKLLMATIKRTPDYPMRSFIKSRWEGLEYEILLQFVEDTKNILSFATTPQKQKELICAWGRMWIIADDFVDYGHTSVEELKNIFFGRNNSKSANMLFKTLEADRDTIYKSLSGNKFENEYIDITKKEFAINFFNTTLTREKVSEQKGGLFFQSLTYLLAPVNMTVKELDTIYYSGAAIQFIDDYFDAEQDISRGSSIFTGNAEIDGEHLKSLLETLRRKSDLLPIVDDLWTLARVGRKFKLPAVV